MSEMSIYDSVKAERENELRASHEESRKTYYETDAMANFIAHDVSGPKGRRIMRTMDGVPIDKPDVGEMTPEEINDQIKSLIERIT